MRAIWAAISALLTLQGFAGCVGGSAESESTEVGPVLGPIPDGGATLIGRVLDGELKPIPGAMVQVDELPVVSTDQAGAFEVRGLAGGEHRVIAQALGFTSIGRKVSLAEGESTEIQLILEALPVEEPYVELLIHKGYDVCSISVLYSAGYIQPCYLGTRTAVFKVNMKESWRYGVFEMVWKTSESMVFVSTHQPNTCNTGNPCWGILVGRSPIRMEAAPESEYIAKTYALDQKKQYPSGKFTMYLDTVYAGYLREEINGTAFPVCSIINQQFNVNPRLGCPFGIGYSLGISFTYYHSTFHYEAPADPRKYSGIPDG